MSIFINISPEADVSDIFIPAVAETDFDYNFDPDTSIGKIVHCILLTININNYIHTSYAFENERVQMLSLTDPAVVSLNLSVAEKEI
jgi:hypothetical protein